ncbi:MAG TPA: hypothetical protein VNQ79_28520 [Blastocatellia bacterium]|nr:hypothetical protein [Blastocatellia bacterium]
MKRLSVTTMLVTALLLTAASGQSPSTQTPAGNTSSQQMQETKLPPLIAALKLSENQKRKLQAVYEDRDKQLMALKQDTSMSEETRKTRLSQINQNINDSLKKILTEKQKKKIVELRQNRGGQTS